LMQGVPSTDLSSLDVIDAGETLIVFEKNLSFPILQLIFLNTDRWWEQLICLLLWYTMKMPLVGRWLVNWANHRIHQMCLRLIHPWMLCRYIRHMTYVMDNRSLSPLTHPLSSFNTDKSYFKRYIARWARCIVQYEPHSTDASYLLLKLIDAAYENIASYQKTRDEDFPATNDPFIQ
jgi:hypothetical protein